MNRSRRGVSLLIRWVLLFATSAVPVLGAGSAAAQGPVVEVERWSSAWVGFFDDFGDGVHPDGSNPGEPIYFVPSALTCGTIADGNESGGALTLTSPSDNCPFPGIASTIANSFLLASEGRVRAAFRLPAMLLDTNLGIGVGNGLDFANLLFLRNGFGHFVAVTTDSDPTGAMLFDQVIPTGSLIELQLEVLQNAATNQVSTVASYRFCSSNPCESELVTPFQLVGTNGVHPQGAIDAAEAIASALFATKLTGGPNFAYQIEEWSIETSGADEFLDPAFSQEVEYAFTSGGPANVTQSGGALELSSTNTDAIVRLGFGDNAVPILGGIPGELDTDATFRFAVPELCTSYGVGLEALEPAGFDFVNLTVVRTENLDTGVGEALYVFMQSETETGNTVDDLFLDAPIVKRATLSTSPDADPALAALTEIELFLGLTDTGSTLIPDGGYRLCTAGGCGAILPLLPHTAAINPTAQVCGGDASVLDPPSDGTGQIDSPEQIGSVLAAVPEPNAILGLSIGIVSLAWRRRRLR